METAIRKTKSQWRNDESDRLSLELQQLKLIRPSEKVAGRRLALAVIQAEERTRPTKSQKKAYKGVMFNFATHLEMLIYIITELPHEWEYCKFVTKMEQKAKGKKAKNRLKASIDRIYTNGFRKHYERGNIRVETNTDNRDRATEDRKKPYVYKHVTENGVETLRFETQTEAKKALGKSFKHAILDVRQQMFKENKKFYARYVEYSTFEETYAKLLEHRAKYLEGNGLTELTVK